MKTTNRIHRNGATKAVKNQIRKPAPADAAAQPIVPAEDYSPHNPQESAIEMRHAVRQANALFELIDCHIQHRSDAFTGDDAEDFSRGISILIDLASYRLTDASNGCHYAAFPKKREVAA